jgi:hypothetical protein
MTTKLPPVTVETPASHTVITPIVRKSRWGRIFDACAIAGAFIAALLQSVGEINFVSLGFTPTQAAWGAMALFVIRFALNYRPVRLVQVKADPGSTAVPDEEEKP